MRIGDRVEHRLLGPGSVLAVRAGLWARVQFDLAPLPKTVARAELALVEGPEESPGVAGRGEPTKHAGRGARAEVRRGAQGRSAGEARASQGELPVAATRLRLGESSAAAIREQREPRGGAATDSSPPGGAARPRPRGGAAADSSPPGGTARARTRRPRQTGSEAALSPADRADLRQTMEALRLGVVPSRFVKEYTVARETELASTEQLLESRRGLRVTLGDYGHGKTHLLDVIERIALERGLVTSRVVLDPHEIPATHPKRLYRALVAALRYPTGGRGLDPLMHELQGRASHREPDGPRASRFYTPYLFALHHGDEELIGWVRDYVQGDHIGGEDVGRVLRRAGYSGPQPLTLSDFRTYGRMYLHMIGTLAAWSADAGHKGLLLLFDEVEGVESLGWEGRVYALQVLKHVAAVTLPRRHLAFDPSNSRELYPGGRGVHRAIPLRFREDQPLCALFALTPLPEIQRLLSLVLIDEDLNIHLRGFGLRELREVVRRIARLYVRAYPAFSLSTVLENEIVAQADRFFASEAGAVREVVRHCVFRLDDLRLRDGQSTR